MATKEVFTLSDGSRRYKYKIRRKQPDGRILTRTKQFRTDKAGQRWARSLEAKIDEGKGVATREVARLTFSDLCARYRQEVIPG